MHALLLHGRKGRGPGPDLGLVLDHGQDQGEGQGPDLSQEVAAGLILFYYLIFLL